jgi:hypothetical protein
MSFSDTHRSDKLSNEEWRLVTEKPFADLLGSPGENPVILENGINITARTYNAFARHITGLTSSEKLHNNIDDITLSDLSSFSLSSLYNIKGIGTIGITELYELYAIHAVPKLPQSDILINEATNNEGSNTESICEEWYRSVKKFCVFKIDGVTYFKIENHIIPFTAIISINEVETSDRSIYFNIDFIAPADRQYFDRDYKKGQVVTYDPQEGDEDPDPIEVRKLIAIFNNFEL